METTPSITGEKGRLRYFDTFAGIGGFALPLSEMGHECVGFSEIDRHASSVYSYHFPSHTPYGDITRIEPAALPDFDLLVGGFPCQAFSVAGKRRGFLDTRGTLFFDVCRIAKEKRPRLLVLENVKGLLNHARGETFRVILSALDELGYDADWQVCNSRHFGVPQNRERVYIVGHLRGQPRPEVFPLGEGEGEPAEEPAGEFAHCLDANYGKGCNDITKAKRTVIGRWVNKETGVVLDDTVPTLRASGGTDIRKRPVVLDVGYQNRPPRVYDESVPTLRANSGGGGHHPPVVLQRPRGNNAGGVLGGEVAPTVQKGFGDGNVTILSMNQQREVRERDVAGALPASQSATQFQAVAIRGREGGATIEVREDGVSNALRTAGGGSSKPMVMYPGHAVNEPDGVARTLKAGTHGVPGGEGLVRDGMAIRRLTPVECERLQGFPDNWTRYGVRQSQRQAVNGASTTGPDLVEISDTQRYKMCGNAVTVNVVREIAGRLSATGQPVQVVGPAGR